MSIHLLCFIHYYLGYFGRVGNRIMVYSSIVIYSPDLLVFARWWALKLLSLCILCNKWNVSDIPPGSLPGMPSLFHIPNGFIVKHRRSVRKLCQCDTNCAGQFTLDAHASRLVACVAIDRPAVAGLLCSLRAGVYLPLCCDHFPAMCPWDVARHHFDRHFHSLLAQPNRRHLTSGKYCPRK